MNEVRAEGIVNAKVVDAPPLLEFVFHAVVLHPRCVRAKIERASRRCHHRNGQEIDRAVFELRGIPDPDWFEWFLRDGIDGVDGEVAYLDWRLRGPIDADHVFLRTRWSSMIELDGKVIGDACCCSPSIDCCPERSLRSCCRNGVTSLLPVHA